MIKPLFSLLLLFLIFSCGKTNNEKEVVAENAEVVDLSEVSEEKKQIVSEIMSFQKDIEARTLDRIPDYFDCPKRVEEIELSLKNSKIRNSIESNSSRLSTDAIKEHFDLLVTEMDLDVINEALKQTSENQLLTQEEVVTNVKLHDCDYETKISMYGKEVKFSIDSKTELETCKKDQQWKFKSNGEFIVLDRRYYL